MSTNSAFTALSSTSVDLASATVLRCQVTERGERAVGTPPAGSSSSLSRREYDVAACTALRGEAPAGSATLVGFTLLGGVQREASPARPTLDLDSTGFFDRPAAGATVDVLLIIGGPNVPTGMGYQGNGPVLDGVGPARAFALVDADASLATAWSALVGWSKDRSPAAALAAGHPLIAVDALRVAIAGGAVADAEGLVAGLATAPEVVRKAARAAFGPALARRQPGSDTDRMAALADRLE